MANYTIQRSLLAAGAVTVTEASVNTDTNVSLVGQNFTGYGDEIATNFLQMLENFAADVSPNVNPRVPGSTAITGQLWYDTTNEVLKVYSGTAWVEQAQTLLGTTESSTLRWNDTNGRYQPEERVRITDAGSLIVSVDAVLANGSVTMNHNGTNLTASFQNTTDFTIAGLTGDLTVTGGRGFSVEQAGGALAIRHNGTDVIFTAASTSNIDLPAGVKLLTAASTTTRAGLNIPEAVAAPSVPVEGDVWVTAAGAFNAQLNGATVDLAAAAGGTVTATDGAVNRLATFTTGTNIDGDANLTWKGTTFNVTGAITATTFGGIPTANLINRASPGTISGTSTITANMNFAGADITLDDNDQILLGTNDVAIDFNGANFVIAGTGTFSISGFNDVVSDQRLEVRSSGDEAIRIIGDAGTWATADSYMRFYDSDESDYGLELGTTAADGSATRINARLGTLNLYGNNTLAVGITSTTTTVTSNGATAGVFRNAFLTGANATTNLTVGDHGGNQHNVGYNETPNGNVVGQNLDTGSFTLTAVSIGKMLTRSTSTSRSVTLANDTDIPVGGTVLIHNAGGGGTLTIVPAGGQTLTWIDGSGSVPASATRTLANNSICTVRKVSTTQWQIWGNGIS